MKIKYPSLDEGKWLRVPAAQSLFSTGLPALSFFSSLPKYSFLSLSFVQRTANRRNCDSSLNALISIISNMTSASSSMSTSLQLSVRGRPSAFDILQPSNDICVVASPGCLTFFHLNGLGSPRHVIHYEQPHQIRTIRFQQYGLLAALRGGVVSLWDPSKSLRPLLGFVSSTGWLTDISWHAGNCNMLASSSDASGGVAIWDVRSTNTPVLKMNAGQLSSSVEWCPSNDNLLAACSDAQTVHVWDVRMVGGINVSMRSGNTSNAVMSSTGGNSVIDSLATFRPPRGGVVACCWTQSGGTDMDYQSSRGSVAEYPSVNSGTGSSSQSASLIVGTTEGALEWWDIRSAPSLTPTNTAGTASMSSSSSLAARQVAGLRPSLLDASSLLLPTPHGRGLVICRRFESSHTTATNVTTNFAATNTNTTSTNTSDSKSKNVQVEMTLQGYPKALSPKEGFDLKSVFQPPSEGINENQRYSYSYSNPPLIQP